MQQLIMKKFISILLIIAVLFQIIPIRLTATDDDDEFIDTRELVCTCESPDVHNEQCPLYEEDTCHCDSDIHNVYCKFYEELNLEKICTCNVVNNEHAETCEMYEIIESSVLEVDEKTETIVEEVETAEITTEEILSLNSTLVEWKSQGAEGYLSIVINDINYVVNKDNYDEVYNVIYDLMLEKATPWTDITSTMTINETMIFKINSDQNILNSFVTIGTGGTLVIINDSEANSTLTIKSSGKLMVKSGNLIIQGRSEDCKVILDGAGSYSIDKNKMTTSNRTGVRNNGYSGKDNASRDKSNENAIQLRDGNVYMEYINIQNFLSNNASTSTISGAINIYTAPYADVSTTGVVKMYAADILFYKCLGRGSGAIGESNTHAGTEIFIYNGIFKECVSTGSINNSGGGAVRAGGGSGIYTFKNCLFQDNLAQAGTKEGDGYNGGGAIRWSLGDNYEPSGRFINCKFIGNIANGRGGAIVCFGGISLTACELTENIASVSGGAIFVSSSTQVTEATVDDKNGSMVLGEGTIIHANEVKYNPNIHSQAGGAGYGGAVHFLIARSKLGDSGIRKDYDLELFVRGAKIYNNKAHYGGAIGVSAYYNYKCGVYIESGSEIYENISNVYSDEGGHGGAIYIDSNDAYEKNHGVNMSGGIIKSNQADGNGGAIYLNNGSMNMSGGEVYNNTANVNGGAIYVSNGNFEITGGSIGKIGQPNDATLGGGAYIIGGDFVLNGVNAVIAGNVANSGAGIYLTGGEPQLYNGVMTGNVASENGGGIYIDEQDITLKPIESVSITSNKAVNGAGIYIGGTVNNPASFGVDDNSTGTVTIDNNISSGYGGAVCINNGLFNLNSHKMILSNNIAQNGGAVTVLSGDFLMSAGKIQNCSATQNGGAVFVLGGNVDIYDGILDGNAATNNGGAIYATSNSTNVLIHISDGEITNNIAGKHAGAIGASVTGSYSATINIGKESCKGINKSEHTDNCCPIMQNNTASVSGGAICLHSETNQLAVNIYCGFITDNIAVRYEGTNSINQEGGLLTIYGGEIEAGISVGLGTYTDLRPGADERQLIMRLWSNYEGGPSEPVLIVCTLGVSLNLPGTVYTWEGHELSGWTTVPNTQTGWNPVGGRFIVRETEDGYMDMYAVWDAEVSYIVYIPDSIVISENGVGQMTLSAELNYFKENSTLNIYIQSDFSLTEPHSMDKLNYEVWTTEPGITDVLKSGDIAASYQYDNIMNKILTFNLLSNPKYANTYSDIITFIVEYEELMSDA